MPYPIQARAHDDATRALLVDRDADTRQMYAEYLKLGSWRVDEASDGREALAKAISLRPDIIVTETRLPGIDGIALCELLRRDVATNTVPVVFVTGDAYPADIERATSAGGDLVLTKPCLPDHLMAELQLVLERAREIHTRAGAVRENARRQLARADEVPEQARRYRSPAPNAQEGPLPWRHDDPTARAASARLSLVRSTADLSAQPRRRRQ